MRGLWTSAVLLLALKLSGGSFTFSFQVLSYSIREGSMLCNADVCLPYISFFCLRGPRTGRSYDQTDCPLGNFGEIRRSSGFANISSDQRWEVSH